MRKILVVVACLATQILPAVVSAQVATPTPSHITDSLLAADSKHFLAYTSGPTVEQIIAAGHPFDSTNNTYLMTFRLHEEAARGPQAKDVSSNIKGLTLNSDVIIIATPLLRKSALTASHQFIFSDYEMRIDTVFL